MSLKTHASRMDKHLSRIARLFKMGTSSEAA